MPSYEMLPFIFMEVEMLLFDNSVWSDNLSVEFTIKPLYDVIDFWIFHFFPRKNNLLEVYDKKINTRLSLGLKWCLWVRPG